MCGVPRPGPLRELQRAAFELVAAGKAEQPEVLLVIDLDIRRRVDQKKRGIHTGKN